MKYKVLILDFDGVFYSGKNQFKFIPIFVDAHRREFLPNVSDEVYEEICTIFPEFTKVSNGHEIVENIYKIADAYPQCKIDAKAFWQIQQDLRYIICFDDATKVDAIEIAKQIPTYIISNSSPNHIKFYMQKLGVKPEWFKEIINNHFEKFDITKQHYYNNILQKENIAPKDAIVFGDSVKSDLLPAQMLGIDTVLTGQAKDLHKLIYEKIN